MSTSPTAVDRDSEGNAMQDRLQHKGDGSEVQTVEVPLEALCIVIEQAQRVGIYAGTPAFDAYMAMPEAVNNRLIERQNVRNDNLLRGAVAAGAHREGKPHDSSICVDCVIAKAESERGHPDLARRFMRLTATSRWFILNELVGPLAPIGDPTPIRWPDLLAQVRERGLIARLDELVTANGK